MKNFYTVVLLIIMVSLNGCFEEDVKILSQDQIDDKIIQNYITNNDISATKDPDGFYYEVLQANPAGNYIGVNEVASIYYKICLPNSPNLKVLEARLSNNSQPVRFLHAHGGLAPEGINFGVSLMKTGEKFRFYLPSKMGLGSYYALGYIGPNEVMIAEVELVKTETISEQMKWEDDSIKSYLAHHSIANYENFASGVHKYTLSPGTGSNPTVGRIVHVVMQRKYLDETRTHSLNDSDTVKIYLPKNENDYVSGISRATEGLKEGLLNMRRGETAVLLVPSYLAFGGTLIEHRDAQNNVVSYGGSIQVLPQKFRDDYVENYKKMQNIYPLTILKYQLKLLDIYMVQ